MSRKSPAEAAARPTSKSAGTGSRTTVRATTSRTARTRKPDPAAIEVAPVQVPTLIPAPPASKPTKLALILDLLRRPDGATLADMMAATGWQGHSVRGALAGALRQRGIVVASRKADGVRRYTATAPQAV